MNAPDKFGLIQAEGATTTPGDMPGLADIRLAPLRSCASHRHGAHAGPGCKAPRNTFPAFNSFVSGPRCGLLLRGGQIIRPFPLSFLSLGFTRFWTVQNGNRSRGLIPNSACRSSVSAGISGAR